MFLHSKNRGVLPLSMEDIYERRISPDISAAPFGARR